MNIINVVNTIRDNQSAEYQARIPEATRANIEDLRYAMIDSDNINCANEFMGSLLNKLVKSVIHTKMFANPLKQFKKGTKPVGDSIEEIYQNFIKGDVFDANGVDLLGRKLPDTKTVYHKMNYKQKYKITVSRELLSKAFSSWDALENYVKTVINTLYNSAELDEFMNMKELIKSAVENNAVVVKEVTNPLTSAEAGHDFIKTVKTVSGLMAFPSTDWNGYLTAQSTDDKAITTFARKSEQVLILDTATDVSVAVDVLASTFNMSVAEFNDTKKVVIDVFPKTSKGVIYGALVDEAFFQIFDDLYTVKSFSNAEGLYDNYYLHVWQTLAYSILVNAVVFVSAEA